MKIVFLKDMTPQQMTGILIKTGSGSIIAIDGGTRGDADAANFTAELKKLAGNENPRIDAWFMTHPHDDHYGVLYTMLTKKLPLPDVGIYCDHKIPLEAGEYELPYKYQLYDYYDMMKLVKWPTLRLQAGNEFTFGDVKIEILMVPSEYETRNTFNNASVVMKITENAEGKEPFSFMILGDLGVEGSNKLLAAYDKDYLKCDMVQMAHHGQNGATYELYKAISPRFAFFATPDWLWTNTIDPAKPGQGPWQTLVVRKWMEEIGAETIRCEKDNVEFEN